MKNVSIFLGLSLILCFSNCKTDPIIPASGIPPLPIVDDPGEENLCDPGVVSFQHEILPIMISSCAYSGCHDAITKEDGIVLDSYEHVMEEVKAGDPNDSELYESIVETDPDDIMPPPPASKLTSVQINLIKTWIEQGAENTDCGTACDSLQYTFSGVILPMMENYCIGCHNDARTDGDVNLSTYQHIKTYADNGQLVGTMRHDQFYAKMPPSGSKVSNCRITQIENWIAEGAPNN